MQQVVLLGLSGSTSRAFRLLTAKHLRRRVPAASFCVLERGTLWWFRDEAVFSQGGFAAAQGGVSLLINECLLREGAVEGVVGPSGAEAAPAGRGKGPAEVEDGVAAVSVFVLEIPRWRCELRFQLNARGGGALREPHEQQLLQQQQRLAWTRRIAETVEVVGLPLGCGGKGL